jgi:hypothetical protein
MLTLKQWDYIGALLVFVLAQVTFGALAYDYGRKSAASDAQEAAEAELAQHKADAERARQEAAEANEKLRKALERKPAARVPEVVRDNPSDCVVPRPVADELRKAIDEVNASR